MCLLPSGGFTAESRELLVVDRVRTALAPLVDAGNLVVLQAPGIAGVDGEAVVGAADLGVVVVTTRQTRPADVEQAARHMDSREPVLAALVIGRRDAEPRLRLATEGDHSDSAAGRRRLPRPGDRQTRTRPKNVMTDDDGGLREKLARRGSASVVGAGFSATFGVLVVVIVTHGFSPTVAGTLFAATSAFLILESVALLGTDTGLVKWLPAQLAAGRKSDLRRTLVISIIPVLAVSLVVAVAVFAAAPVLAPYLVGADAEHPRCPAYSRVLAIVLPVAALHDLATAATRGLGSTRPTVLVENIGRLGLQALAVLVAYRQLVAEPSR